MQIQQLTLFSDKDSFNYERFESTVSLENFVKLSESVHEAFYDKFSKIDITAFDSTTRANMLNNLVLKTVQSNCSSYDFRFVQSLTNTRRSFCILSGEYLLFFKKHPISNLKTTQDDLIKTQSLDKHVIFLVYTVDMFWSAIKSIKLQYIENYEYVVYEKDITNLVQSTYLPINITSNTISSASQQINVKVKEELINKKATK
jgi:hypothetical protein